MCRKSLGNLVTLTRVLFLSANFSATFHDAILILASAVRRTVDLGYGEDIRNFTMNNSTIALDILMEGLWNRTFPGKSVLYSEIDYCYFLFAGASGNVYINPQGDRADDLSMYYMTNIAAGTFSVSDRQRGFDPGGGQPITELRIAPTVPYTFFGAGDPRPPSIYLAMPLLADQWRSVLITYTENRLHTVKKI